VLVIDDSEIVLESVRTTLEDAGFIVTTRSMAYGSSWEILERKPDVVLVDVNMPGLSGQDIVAIARARADLGKTRVLLFSSEPPEKLEALARGCGAHGWIRKTADHAELAEAVWRWATATPRNEPATHECPVLFVDHDPSMLNWYRDVLGGTLSSVEFASTGAAALRRLESGPTPQLVACEVALPGLSGAELYRRAVEHDPDLQRRFLFITGAASRESWVAHFINGLEARVLHKPVSAAHLTDEVTKRLTPRTSA
jgi:two-component system chemotaxis response regulator CheY